MRVGGVELVYACVLYHFVGAEALRAYVPIRELKLFS